MADAVKLLFLWCPLFCKTTKTWN